MEDSQARVRKPIPYKKIAVLLAVSAAAVMFTTQIAPRVLFPTAPERLSAEPLAAQDTPILPLAATEPAQVPAQEEVITAPSFSPPKDAAPTPSTEADARVKELEEQLKAAKAEPKPAYGAESIHLLDQELRSTQAELRSLKAEQNAAWRTVALLDAYDHVKDAALSGKPYAEELLRMQQLLGTEGEAGKAMATLAPHASRGIPQQALLDRSFDVAVRAAFASHEKADDGFFARVRANFARLIVIRRIGDHEGASPEIVIARAESAMKREDLEAAVREIASLKEPRSAAFETWLANARARLALAPAFTTLKSAIVAREQVSSMSAPPPPPAPAE